MQPIPRSQLVYFPIPTGGGTAGSALPFPNVPELDGCLIVGCQLFTDAQLAFDPSRIAVLPAADALNVTLTMNEGQDQRFKQMPMTSLIAQLNAGVWKEFDPFFVNWQSSEYEFNFGVTANTALVSEWFYIREEDDPEFFAKYRR